MELRCDVIRIVFGAWIRTRFAVRTAGLGWTRQVEMRSQIGAAEVGLVKGWNGAGGCLRPGLGMKFRSTALTGCL